MVTLGVSGERACTNLLSHPREAAPISLPKKQTNKKKLQTHAFGFRWKSNTVQSDEHGKRIVIPAGVMWRRWTTPCMDGEAG